MRILVISQYFYPENLRINDLCKSLSEGGHEITILTGKPNYPTGNFFKGYNFFNKNFEKIYNIDVYRANILPRGSGSGPMLFLNYISFLFFGFFKLFTIKGRFDVIFVYAPSPITVGYLGILASKLFKAKSFLWVHDLWPESVKIAGGINNIILLKLIDVMTRSIYLFYENILVQSPSFRDYLINQSVPDRKITYYPYYAESFYKKESKHSERKKILPKGVNILFAGNLGIAQSFDTIIDATLIASKKINNFNIIVLGDGRDKNRIVKKIKKLNLQNNFHFLGSFPPEEMPYYFSSSDALLVSLKKAKIFSLTIPGKLQSYLASGKPIIASLDGIGKKIVEEANCGFTSPAEDQIKLAKSFISLANLNEKEKNKLGSNSLKYYEKEFDKEKLLKKLIDIFEK